MNNKIRLIPWPFTCVTINRIADSWPLCEDSYIFNTIQECKTNDNKKHRKLTSIRKKHLSTRRKVPVFSTRALKSHLGYYSLEQHPPDLIQMTIVPRQVVLQLNVVYDHLPNLHVVKNETSKRKKVKWNRT